MGEQSNIPSSISMISSQSSQAEKKSGKTKEVRQPFPWKVFEMLEDAEKQDFDDIVSWNERGDGFKVHDVKRFTSEIIGKYFNQSKYKSFQRQLSLYGFERSTEGEDKGLRFHECLRRDNKMLCRQMKPVGYKPRGQEKIREKVESDNSGRFMSDSQQQSPIRFTEVKQHGIPSVVSSDSIYKAHPISPLQNHESCLIPPSIRHSHPSITERLVTTDSIALFEGMPFFLMTTLPPPEVPSLRRGSPTSSSDLSSHERGGLMMKKAWDIGFAVASSLPPSTTTAEVVPADSLNISLQG